MDTTNLDKAKGEARQSTRPHRYPPVSHQSNTRTSARGKRLIGNQHGGSDGRVYCYGLFRTARRLRGLADSNSETRFPKNDFVTRPQSNTARAGLDRNSAASADDSGAVCAAIVVKPIVA